jgi:predicted RNA-binding protein associated with RNAse of E/G family
VSEPIVVHKLNEKGEEILQYAGCLLGRSERSLTLEARFEGKDEEFHGLQLRNGDRLVEVFYSDRWYNVFAIHDARDGRLKGWYCNVTRPASIQAGHVYAEDLALDLIVLPDASWQVLDEEQFAELDLSIEERQLALRAITELQTLVVRRVGPFEALGDP